MRTIGLGSLLVVLLASTVAAVAPRTQETPPEPASRLQSAAAARDGLIAFSETVERKYQQVTVIDPKQRVISVYHVDLASGTITLRSVRNIHWDLQMSDFNGKPPLSQEIQAMAEQR